MSTTSKNSSSASMKRLALFAVSMVAAAVVLALPQAQQALPISSRPVRAAALLLRPASALMPGANDYWHTEGSRILDRHNRPVRISGVNWSGLETKEAVPGGLETQDYRAILRTIKQNGFNTVRIPFSNEMVEMPSVPEHIRFNNAEGPINTDLRDLTSIEILDRIVAAAGKIGLKVILDNHRSEAGSSAEESGLWYTAQFPASAWIEDWKALANRYENDSTVIGMDLRNEPHNALKGGACWDCGGDTDWHRAAERAGDAVLAVNPRLLIFVEGVDSYGGDTYWWGGNLEGVRHSPIHLSVPGRLVYSAHEYGPTEYSQPWFNASTSSASLTSIWRRHWAYISEAGIAPVWIGEFGTPNTDADVQSSVSGSEGQWFAALVDFLQSHPGLGWTYWGVNGEDRYGLLDTSYSSQGANAAKLAALETINHGGADGSTSPVLASAQVAYPSTYPTVPTTSTQPKLNMTPASAAVTYAGTAAPTRTVDMTPARRGETKTMVAARPEGGVQSAIAASVFQAVRNANLSLAAQADEGR